MKKKKIIIAAGAAVLFLVILFTCIGSNDIVLSTGEQAPDATKKSDSTKLKVEFYLENGESMHGFLGDDHEFRSVLVNYLRSLEADTLSMYYIGCIQPDNAVHIENSNFGNPGDLFDNMRNEKNKMNGSDTHIDRLIDTVLKRVNDSTVCIFVSDCISDMRGRNTAGLMSEIGASMEASFKSKLTKMPNLSVEIVKVDSKFKGTYFPPDIVDLSKDKDGEREKKIPNYEDILPFYIWVIGSQENLARLNAELPRETPDGKKNDIATITGLATCPYDVYNSEKADDRPSGKIAKVRDGKYNICLDVDLTNTLYGGEEISDSMFSLSAEKGVTLTSVTPCPKNNRGFTHRLLLEAQESPIVPELTIDFFGNELPGWVRDIDSDNPKPVTRKTFGIEKLINGVHKAFSSYPYTARFVVKSTIK